MKKAIKLDLWRTMVRCRLFEEKVAEVFLEGKQPKYDLGSGPIGGGMHLAAGQEPVAAGLCAHLTHDDTLTGTHRAHHFAIAKGMSMHKLAAELMMRDTGCCRGKGGHMHLYDASVKFSCSGIVGAGMGPACGAALAARQMGRDWVAVATFSDGAANAGVFHESLNIAAKWKLPVLYVCEDNSWAISVSKEASTSVARNSERAASYGIPGAYVEGNDVVKIYKAAGEAVARARKGEGPTLLEIETDRYLGHFEGDVQVYRPKNEVTKLKERDPIEVFGNAIISAGETTAEELEQIKADAKKEVDQAFEQARKEPLPADMDAFKNVFTNEQESIAVAGGAK